MSPPPRRLTFAVGTSLITASLALSGTACDKKTTNPGPEPPHVNEGPEPAPEEIVNEGPVADPAEEGEGAEDAGGDAEDVDAPEQAPDGPHVNTVPDDDTQA